VIGDGCIKVILAAALWRESAPMSHNATGYDLAMPEKEEG
jgi:hypothetical protein